MVLAILFIIVLYLLAELQLLWSSTSIIQVSGSAPLQRMCFSPMSIDPTLKLRLKWSDYRAVVFAIVRPSRQLEMVLCLWYYAETTIMRGSVLP